MPSRPLCIIYNPKAGRGFSARLWRQVQALLVNAAEFRPTAKRDDAMHLAEAAAREGFATVVAAGGDGTVHEVANGLLRAGPTASAFGVIPLGSGNDYARMLDLPQEPRALIERLLGDQTWSVDAGKVTSDGGRRECFFVNTIGFGLSGAVTYEACRITGLRGVPLYGLAALKAIYRSYRAIPARVRLDAQEAAGATLYLSIALGRSEGAGFVVAPDATLDDGWFDYLHAGAMTRLRALGYMPRMLLGRLPESGGPLLRGRCRTVSIQADEPLHCHCDGELFSDPTKPARQFEVTLLPGAIKIRGPKPATR